MYTGGIKSALRVNVSNIPGWRTNRHIVVIESDDWGSIRMSSLEAFNNLLKAGIPVDRNHYTINDALECNEDLEMMCETISRFKDKTGRHPVFTGVNVVANPDYEAIRKNGFTKYVFEPYTESCKRFDNHDRVYELWKEGIEKRLMVPVFHGREHLNTQFWLKALKNDNKSTKVAFDNGVTGIPRKGIDSEIVPSFQAAFDIESTVDLPYQKIVLKEGLDLFEQLFGYRSKYFVPTNGPFNNSLETVLNECGIQYINTGKRQSEPLGDGKYRINTRYLGDSNHFDQLYLTRNCFFEPSSCGFESPSDWNWVDSCMKEIQIAFRWHKPATISSHRVNYIGFLHPENREKSLKQLSELLSRMLKRWPDIEFMTSVELGDLIASKEK